MLADGHPDPAAKLTSSAVFSANFDLGNSIDHTVMQALLRKNKLKESRYKSKKQTDGVHNSSRRSISGGSKTRQQNSRHSSHDTKRKHSSKSRNQTQSRSRHRRAKNQSATSLRAAPQVLSIVTPNRGKDLRQSQQMTSVNQLVNAYE